MSWKDEPPVTGPLYESYSRPDSGLRRYHLRAMGTDQILLLAAEDGPELRDAVQEVFGIVQGLEERLSKFLPESDLSLANRLAAGRPVNVGEDCLCVLQRAREAWELTGGAFDPSVGSLLAAWGLVDMRGRVPAREEIRRLLDVRGMDHVEVDLEAGTVRYDREGVSLDLGGIGKGYAVDLAVRHLRSRGIASGAFISGRSTVLTWGSPPADDMWRVEVCHPSDPDEALCALRAEPGAISSSGAYERATRVGTREYGHIIDPRSGQPVCSVASATVWTASALLGDVLSTTVFVLGDEAFREGGAVDRVLDAWTPPGEEPRASFLWAVPDTGRWGGLDLRTHHAGRAAFVAET